MSLLEICKISSTPYSVKTRTIVGINLVPCIRYEQKVVLFSGYKLKVQLPILLRPTPLLVLFSTQLLEILLFFLGLNFAKNFYKMPCQ